MTDDYVPGANVAQHRCQHFTCVRAFFGFGRAILASNFYVRTFESIGDGLEGGEDRCDYDFAMVGVCDEGLQCECSVNCLAKRLVHLPVSGDYRFAHIKVALQDLHDLQDFQDLSLSAATPGSSSSERNSKVAPPPVEMWVIWSATPARVTAETESPPPTITVAPRCAASATAFATPIVP